MSTTGQPTTFSELYTDLQNRAREQTGITATETQAKRYINVALHDMHVGQGEKFPWAERTAYLVTQAQYTTGTASALKGSTALVGISTAWKTANDFNVNNMRAWGKITIDGNPEVYEIDSVTSDTAAVLKSDFIDDNVSGVDYVYFEDEYTLASDFLRPIDQQKFDAEASIDLIGRTEFRRRYPSNRIPNKPVVATLGYRPVYVAKTGAVQTILTGVGGTSIILAASDNDVLIGDEVTVAGTINYDGTYTCLTRDTSFFSLDTTFIAAEVLGGYTYSVGTSQVKTVRFHPPPSEATMMKYQYVTSNLAVSAVGVEQAELVADTDEPIVPLQYRQAIIYHALAAWYRDKKDDVRSQEVMNEYSKIMLRIISDNEIGGARPQFRPRMGLYRRRAVRPWGGSGSRYDINGEFDRFER